MASFTSTKDIEGLRSSGRILASALQQVQQAVKPGVATSDLDAIAQRAIEAADAQPSFLGFEGYPASLCVSINQEVVHGIPRLDRIVSEGDIVGLDLGVNYQGYFTDAAITVPVGRVDGQAMELIAATKQALDHVLTVIHPGATTGDIGAAVQSVIDPLGYGIVRQLTGHGVGRAVHEEPKILNVGRPGTGLPLQTGMVLAIEPMITLGDEQVQTLDDGWTVVTVDGSLAAHFEHTVLVTATGVEVMTKM